MVALNLCQKSNLHKGYGKKSDNIHGNNLILNAWFSSRLAYREIIYVLYRTVNIDKDESRILEMENGGFRDFYTANKLHLTL